MHYVRSRHHKIRLSTARKILVTKFFRQDQGSQVVGFALVVPLLIYFAVVMMQLSLLAVDKVTISTAAHSAARNIAARGASQSQAVLVAKQYLDTHGLADCGSDVRFTRFQVSGIRFVEVHVNQCVRLDSLNRDVHLATIARAIDESKL